MSTPITTNRPLPSPDVNAGNSASAAAKTGATGETGETIPTPAEARSQLNASIITASFEIAIESHNEPLALLYKTAITGINELLKPQFGENALHNAMSQDNTAAGTAGRIVSLSTGFYEAFKKQHPGEDEAAVLKNFMATIRSGFERGYQEASDILQGMNVLGGDIAAAIGKTYELVQQGYADFEAAQSALIGGAAASGGDSTAATNAAS